MIDTVIAPAVYIVLLTIIMVIDLKHHLILNKLVYPGIVIALVLSWFGIGLLSAVIGGAIYFGLMMMARYVFKAGMGLGDIKLSLLIGLMVGYPFIFIYMAMLGVSSVLVYVFLRFIKHKKSSDEVPFGSVMCLMAMATILSGGAIWQLLIGLKF